MDQDGIAIRPARQADVSIIAACVRSAYQHYVATIGVTPIPILDSYSAVFRNTTGGR